MNNKPTESLLSLSIQLLNDDQTSPEDLDQMARLLRDEIEEHRGIDNVRLQSANNQPPAGTKAGAEVFTIGALLLAILPDTLPAIIGFFQEWTLRPGNQPVKIKAQIADRIIEVEFDPRVTSRDEIASLAREFQSLVEAQAED